MPKEQATLNVPELAQRVQNLEEAIESALYMLGTGLCSVNQHCKGCIEDTAQAIDVLKEVVKVE